MKVILSVPDEGYFEHTWWRLFWAYLMMVILSVPDEGYFECTWWRLFWAYLMKVILSIPDAGYFERTWWRLFWAYLMKVIPETCHAHSIRYLHFYYNNPTKKLLVWRAYKAIKWTTKNTTLWNNSKIPILERGKIDTPNKQIFFFFFNSQEFTFI